MRLLLISPGDHGVKRDLRPWLSAIRPQRLLLREFKAKADELRALIQLAESHGTEVIVHEGCAQSGSLRLNRALHQRANSVQPAAPFGRSCHSVEEASAAFAQGAEYVLLSPFARPLSKPLDRRALLSPHSIRAAATLGPCLLLGGVRPESITRVAQLGAAGVAVLGGVFNQADPHAAAAAYADYQAACETIRRA